MVTYHHTRFERTLELFGALCFIALIASVLAGVLSGCDMQTATGTKSDSARKADSTKAAQDPASPIKYHDVQICAAGTTDAGPYQWEMEARVGPDTLVLPMDTGICRPFGPAPDSLHVRLISIGGSHVPDSAWILIDSSSTKYWITWTKVRLTPDSLQWIADSAAGLHRHGLDNTRGAR